MTSNSEFFISNGHGNVELAHGDVVAGPGEVLIATEFAGVNRGDVLGLQGAYGEPTPHGTRVGQDIVGVVNRVGPGVSKEWIDRRVFGQISGAWGWQAVAPTSVLAGPGDLSPEVAVTLPLAGFTALRLHRQARELVGELRDRDVLITGGTGAVGAILTDLLLADGARVWVLSRHETTSDRPGLRIVTSLNDMPAIQLGFESVGGPLLDASLHALRPGGHLWWFGEASRRPVSMDFFSHLAAGSWHLHHFAHWVHDGNDVIDLNELRDLVTAGVITAPRHNTITPDELPVVIDGIARGINGGKVVIRF